MNQKPIKSMCIFTAMLAALSFSACENTQSPAPSESESLSESSSMTDSTEERSENSVFTTTETAAETEAATEETPSESILTTADDAPESESESESEASLSDCSDTAERLMQALNAIDQLGGGNIVFDTSDTITTSDGRTYAKVADTRFFSTDDIREFMEESLTEKMIAQRYSAMVGDSDARYIDTETGLYGDTAAKGCGFPWTGAVPVISDITEDSFTAAAEYDDYGSTSVLMMHIVLDQGVWKIDAIEYSETANQ